MCGVVRGREGIGFLPKRQHGLISPPRWNNNQPATSKQHRLIGMTARRTRADPQLEIVLKASERSIEL